MSLSLLTNKQNGRHSSQRVVAHGSEWSARTTARSAGVVQTNQLFLHQQDNAVISRFIIIILSNIYRGDPALSHLLPIRTKLRLVLVSMRTVRTHQAYGRL